MLMDMFTEYDPWLVSIIVGESWRVTHVVHEMLIISKNYFYKTIWSSTWVWHMTDIQLIDNLDMCHLRVRKCSLFVEHMFSPTRDWEQHWR